MLLNAADEEALCLTCHGAAGAGATTNVVSGVQYALARRGSDRVRGSTILGALRNGGFVTARDRLRQRRPARPTCPVRPLRQTAKVPVLSTRGNIDLARP